MYSRLDYKLKQEIAVLLTSRMGFTKTQKEDGTFLKVLNSEIDERDVH